MYFLNFPLPQGNHLAILQSINQSKFYSSHIPSIVSLSGVTATAVFNRKIDEAVPQHQPAIGRPGVYAEKAKSKRYIWRCFLKITVEVAE